MAYISTGELTQLRADATKTLGDETCSILRPTSSANAIGEMTLTWGTISASCACRLRPAGRAYLAPVGEQQQVIADWVVTLPHGTAVEPGDRIVIDSITYEVVQSWDEETWKTATRATVKRLEAS